MRTLTRDEAHDVVAMAADEGLAALLDLQEAWVGHRDVNDDDTAESVAGMLHEYVDAVASEDNDRAPRGSDPTELVNPWEAE